jgi:predicted ATP-grasp superfamily ATP-dependent carboligase
MEPVLILDANERSALAATRALGRRGVPVVTADEMGVTLAGASRYARASFVYPSPYRMPARFLQTVRNELAARAIRVVLPMTEVTTQVLTEHREEFRDARIPVGTLPALDILTDKRRIHALAKQLDIPTPETRIVECPDELGMATAGLTYPMVVKPYRSRIRHAGTWLRADVRHVSSRGELERVVATTDVLRHHPFIIQERIDGHGAGVFALYDRGRAVGFFAHRRVRERPPSGGVSVLSESVHLDPHLLELSRRLLDHVAWHGVAMVEFKVRADGVAFLIEVNPRFWGSLQLAVDAGADFPWFAYRLALGDTPATIGGYRVGVRNRWLLGDLDHLYLRWKASPGWLATLRALAGFITGFAPGTRHEVDRWDDLRPFLVEVKQYVARRAGSHPRLRGHEHHE